MAAPPADALRLEIDFDLPRPHWAAAEGLQAALRRTPPAYGKTFLARATDIRWDDDTHVLVAGVRDGTFRISLGETDRTPLEIAFPHLPNSGARGSHVLLGASPAVLAAAAGAHLLTWFSRQGSGPQPIRTEEGFDSFEDLDVDGDRIVVLGLRRDDKGKLAADGGIAWTARFASQLTDLRTVQVSVSGAGARGIDSCAGMGLGRVRFLPDGSFVVVPGAEPGIFLRDRGGRLLKTWPADLVGFDAGCPITESEMLRFSANVAARYGWINRRRVLDEVLALPQGIGFVVRSRSQGVTRWQLSVLSPEGKVAHYDIPVTSPSEYARLAGDARGGRIALLLNLDTPETPPAGSARVLVAQLPAPKPRKP